MQPDPANCACSNDGLAVGCAPVLSSFLTSLPAPTSIVLSPMFSVDDCLPTALRAWLVVVRTLYGGYCAQVALVSGTSGTYMM